MVVKLGVAVESASENGFAGDAPENHRTVKHTISVSLLTCLINFVLL